MKRLLVLLALLAFAIPAGAAPKTRATKVLAKPTKTASKHATKHATKATKSAKRTRTSSSRHVPKRGTSHGKDSASAHARVAFSVAGELRPAREVVGRREEPLTLEEDIAKQIEKLLRGPLKNGITGLYVADARTGEPLFAVNADDALNPASNVKMISMATALELLGPTFRYTTRLLGAEPDRKGVVHGGIYLLGTWDPTLSTDNMADLADQLVARGVKQLDGDILVGSDPTRDGIFRAMVPVEIKATSPGEHPTATRVTWRTRPQSSSPPTARRCRSRFARGSLGSTPRSSRSSRWTM